MGKLHLIFDFQRSVSAYPQVLEEKWQESMHSVKMIRIQKLKRGEGSRKRNWAKIFLYCSGLETEGRKHKSKSYSYHVIMWPRKKWALEASGDGTHSFLTRELHQVGRVQIRLGWKYFIFQSKLISCLQNYHFMDYEINIQSTLWNYSIIYKNHKYISVFSYESNEIIRETNYKSVL